MIPITIITGFLGSGKTTLILNLLPQLPSPPHYRLALLKNEFGEVATDSLLTSSQSISGVQELLNGCICCNLVGQLSSALVDLARDYKPDRIIIETSGSAFPATLAMEVKRVAEESRTWDKDGKKKEGGEDGGGMGKPWFELDGVISVVDVENWSGYEDTSVTAKMQARYTDLIVLNKHELVSERRLEDVEDKILELEVDPPIPRTKTDKGWVDKDIIFGLDAKLASAEVEEEKKHGHEHQKGEVHKHDHEHSSEVEVLSITLNAKEGAGEKGVDTEKLRKFLEQPTKDAVYRIKGILYASTAPKSSDGSVNPATTANHTPAPGRAKYILNWAFGRWTFTPVPMATSSPSDSSSATPNSSGEATPLMPEEEPVLRLTVVTAKYEANMFQKEIESGGLVALEGGAASELTVKRVL